jgi:transposase InsO family protein
LTIHADRGAPMRAKTLAQFMADLEIERSHSRPRVSNDNRSRSSRRSSARHESAAFQRDEVSGPWTLEQELLRESPEAGDYFGQCVLGDVDGDGAVGVLDLLRVITD